MFQERWLERSGWMEAVSMNVKFYVVIDKGNVHLGAVMHATRDQHKH